ncbi:MAG: type II toxin-antitoxin system VapC family toxin [Myxococcales bacterium]|nr:type II toxin-antitoxin system VapC family toxin [Myxococcales bacterium]MCB9536586.1 type II toxin-antitoxin system VapC family toxin [Myxococcales bacterium]
MDRVALDTSFLIDLQNERRGRGRARGAMAFLRARPSTELVVPIVALAEYLEGFDDPQGREATALVGGLRTLDVTLAVVHCYAAEARRLRSEGRLIGTNDLWIACTARAAGLPILTRNVEHFARVAGVQVVDYAATV